MKSLMNTVWGMFCFALFSITGAGNTFALAGPAAAQTASGGNDYSGLLWTFGFMLVTTVIGVLLFFWLQRRMMMGGGGGGGGGMNQFGKSKARKFDAETQVKVRFSDVAGCDSAKRELMELVRFLNDPTELTDLGGKQARGALLVGPPGTGKTLIARAVAGEANADIFVISGSDFVEMFVGVGASRVRDLFEQASKSKRAIVFIDEIDAVGRHRGTGIGGGNDEREQTLNQLLVEMDGFETKSNLLILAATNRPDILDPALLRPGRFDKQITIDGPDVIGREEILKVHVRIQKMPLAADVDLKAIAKVTPGYVGAQLSAVVYEAAQIRWRLRTKQIDDLTAKYIAEERAAEARNKSDTGSTHGSVPSVKPEDEKKSVMSRLGDSMKARNEPPKNFIPELSLEERMRNRAKAEVPKLVYMADFAEAVDKVLMGAANEERGHRMGQELKSHVIRHEVGHGWLAQLMFDEGKTIDPVHKVTVVPRSRALGYMLSLPLYDTLLKKKKYILARILIAMGGRAAQHVFYGEEEGTDTGASNDFKQAWDMAHALVTQYGMSKLGILSLSGGGGEPFLGKSMAQQCDYSQTLHYEIETEVRRILNDAFKEAVELLTRDKEKLMPMIDYLENVDETILGDKWLELAGRPPLEDPRAKKK